MDQERSPQQSDDAEDRLKSRQLPDQRHRCDGDQAVGKQRSDGDLHAVAKAEAVGLGDDEAGRQSWREAAGQPEDASGCQECEIIQHAAPLVLSSPNSCGTHERDQPRIRFPLPGGYAVASEYDMLPKI